jgi:hypothetical protein
MDDKEIEDLQKQLENLTIEFNRRTNLITKQINTLRRSRRLKRQQKTQAEVNSDKEPDQDTLVLGNIVRIVNNYKNKQGVEGEIIRFSAGKQQRVTIRDKQGKEYTRAPWNLEIVTP